MFLYKSKDCIHFLSGGWPAAPALRANKSDNLETIRQIEK